MYKDKCGTGYENSTRAIFQGAGEYDIPIIEPTKITENNFIGFNEVLSSKQNNCGVHFFLDDYQFQRLWNTPDRYIERLQNSIVCYHLILAFTLIIRKRCRFITTIANIG